jgi:segregation and condensation protein B
MKKRKGKQAQSEEAVSAEQTETTAVDAPVPTADDDVPADLPDAATLPNAVVSEIGDDDVTNRLDVSGIDGAAPGDAGGDDDQQATEAAESAADDQSAPEGESTELEAPGAEGASGEGTGVAAGGESSEPLPMEDQRLESILESILFAADRPLGVNDLKRLLGERDAKRLTAALEALREKRAESGIQVVSVAGGWQLRTHHANGAWVSKLVAGRPPRLSRAMMETLSIVAYRQPITRPEVDEIRGVDCGPVLHTLLDRGLIRVIGKKEEVGRPMLYGTTPEFLKTFSLKDLADLPTLREFHELGAEDRARVDATVAEGAGATVVSLTDGDNGTALPPPRPVAGELSDPDPDEEDALLEALDQAASAATRATASVTKPEGESAPESEPEPDAAVTAAPARESGE